LYGCESLSVTLREKDRLSVYENRVLRRIFGRKKSLREGGEDCAVRSFVSCMLHQMLLGWSNQEGWGGRDT